MVRRAYRQRSLVEVLLPDADKLWDPTLRRIDALLEDDALVDRVAEALAQRHPQSRRRGRLGTPAAVVLRMLVLKHLHDWSFDECEREVRGGLVYRAFCRIDGERVPDAKTLIRLAHLLDEPVLKDVLARLVALGRERRLITGRRMRLDTTVVETNIHYPTDAALLADGVRVLTRTLRQIGEQVRDRTRSVARRVFEIAQRSRTAGNRVWRGGPRAEQGANEGPLPGTDGDHACSGAPSRSRVGAGARPAPRGATAGDDRADPSGPGANAGARPPGRYALPGQGGQPLRAAHRDHSEG